MNLYKRFSLRISILFIIVFGFLTACTTRKAVVTVPVDIGPAFSQSGEITVPAKWWTVFNDKQLDEFIQKAFASNLDLKTAWQRLKATRAVARRGAAALVPDFNVSLTGEAGHTGDASYEDLSLRFASEYEVDLWGRIRSTVDAQRFQARAGYADYQTAALTVAAEITRTWYKLVETRNQIALIDQQAGTNEKMLSLIRARVGSGQVRSVDILRQKKLIAATKEQKIAWETSSKVQENQLAVLLGNSPGKGMGEWGKSLPVLPPLPGTGVPMDLIRRRPDVKSAFFLVRAADRQLASAVSSLYPRLSINASATSVESDSSNLIKDWARSLVGNLLAPIFQGGELRAEVKRSRAVQKQRLYEYGQTVLNAFLEVENALIREKNQLERIRNLEQQLALSGKTLEQLRLEYFNGISDYLDILTAIRDEQQLRRETLSARFLLLEYRIALYRALAGGFETPMEKENDGN